VVVRWLLAALDCARPAIEDIRVIEKGGASRHVVLEPLPGADVRRESYVYLPLLEEIGYIPTEKYAHAAEILTHSQAIAKHYDLYANALLPNGSHGHAVGRRQRSVDHLHQPRRRHAGAVRVHGQRPVAPPDASGQPRQSRVAVCTRSPSGSLWYTMRDCDGR